MKQSPRQGPNESNATRWIVAGLSAYALLGGLITLGGWFGGMPRLTDWMGSGISMFVNTALAAACAGAALLIGLSPQAWPKIISRVLGIFVALIGGATFFENITQIDLGIDTLLLSQPWGVRATTSSGRMGPPGAISYALLGTALALIPGRRRARRIVPALGMVVCAMAMLALIGYGFRADPLFATTRLTCIAMQTATIILALGFAVIASVPDLEPLRTLREDSAAGLLARCALPVIVVVPIALGALFVKGRVAGWFDRGMGTALLVVALLALLCGLLWWCTAAVAAHERVSRDNEARFRSYFELGLIGMAITSPDKGVLEVNDELCNILGYERAELLRMTWGDLTEPEDLAADTAQFNRVLAGEIDGYSLDKQIVRKDGQIILATISVKCVRRADGSVNYFVALLQDITERKRAEERLEQAVTDRTASLRQAVAQMEEFSYTVSHDLRAPLRGMKAYTEILLQDFAASLPEEARQYLGRISANANRLDKMILDVLTLSRLARAEFQLERVDVDQLVRQIVEQHPGMQSPHARIEIEPLPDVFGHEPSLTQALSNLLNNAVKFVTPNVTPRVRVWGEQQDGHVRLWVTDNGIGVDPQYQGRLFNMFERVHPELKYEGTGVGLAIVRKAVERMGGKVGVESDGATGSRFWIEVKSADDSNNGGVRASRGWAGISDNKTCSAPPAQAA